MCTLRLKRYTFCDVVRYVTFMLCAATFCNIMSCDVYVMLLYTLCSNIKLPFHIAPPQGNI
jgi:hypothetical protein